MAVLGSLGADDPTPVKEQHEIMAQTFATKWFEVIIYGLNKHKPRENCTDLPPCIRRIDRGLDDPGPVDQAERRHAPVKEGHGIM